MVCSRIPSPACCSLSLEACLDVFSGDTMRNVLKLDASRWSCLVISVNDQTSTLGLSHNSARRRVVGFVCAGSDGPSGLLSPS